MKRFLPILLVIFICTNSYSQCPPLPDAIYCYDSDESNVVAFELCPDPGMTLDVIIGQGSFESCCDGLTVFSGASGSGTTGTQITAITGTLTGSTITAAAPDECLIFVTNSDFSVSCASGSQTELQVYVGTVIPVPGCNNPLATNFNPLATCDDGSCVVASCPGVTAGCATGCITEFSGTSTGGGPGTTASPATGANFEICYELQGYSETGTNWVHGVYPDNSNNDPCLIYSISAGTTGAQQGVDGAGDWIFDINGSNGPGFYFDRNLDGASSDNFGDDGDGTTFSHLSLDPFCFSITVTMGATCVGPIEYTPAIAVSGDGDSGSWTNADCLGADAQFSPTSSPSFNMNGAIILPVELKSFTGETMERSNMLKWATASEINSSYHSLERSVNTRNWTTIGTIEANGNASNTSTYNFEDTTPTQDAYYRIKFVDFDGSYTFSNTVRLLRTRSNKGNEITLYPNPTNAESFITSDYEINERVFITITDLSGKEILTQTVANPNGVLNTSLDLSDLLSGIYLVNIQTSTSQQVIKLVKQQ